MATPILELQRAMGAASGNEGPWVHFVDEHGAIVSQDTAVTDYPSDSYDRVMADIEAYCGPREGYP